MQEEERIVCDAKDCSHNCATRCDCKYINIGKNRKCESYDRPKTSFFGLVLPHEVTE